MKSVWGPEIYDMAAWNSSQPQVEEADEFNFAELFVNDAELLEWDVELQ